MMSFSRSSSVEYEPVDLAMLVKEDLHMIRSTLPSSITVTCRLESPVPMVLANATQVSQIMMNLAANARDAMSEVGEFEVELHPVRCFDTVGTVSHNPVVGDWVSLSVSDTGSGILPEQINRIFNPFYTTKEAGKGTGLGLAMVYKIISDMGGHILVDSEPNRGTTFTLLFEPLSGPQASSMSGSMEEPLPQSPTAADNGERIMVVDDDEMIAEVTCHILDGAGYQTEYFADAQEALAELRATQGACRLLISDQTMPHMSGLDLIKAARQAFPDLPVLLCSGYSELIDPQVAMDMALPFLQKPVRAAALLDKVSELLGKTPSDS